MKYQDYKEAVKNIIPADPKLLKEAAARQNALVKPPGSLGKLEDISIRLAGITGELYCRPGSFALLVFAADNGIVEQGVSSAPQSVTLSQTVNMTRGITGMSALAGCFGDRIIVTDVGIKGELPANVPVINRKVRHGTGDFSREAAMTEQETVQAINIGLETALKAIDEGADCIGTGEMGIGNTSTSAALIATFTGKPVKEVTGYGGTITDEAYENKVRVIEKALKLHRPDSGKIINAMSLVGGLDIAAMAGAYLGCALKRIPVVIDGLISATAALCAVKLCRNSGDYMFLSHISAEPGYKAVAEALQLETERKDFVPYFDLGMRLGEGSGCPLMFRVIEAAAAIMNDMATFQEASIDDGYLEEIRKEMAERTGS